MRTNFTLSGSTLTGSMPAHGAPRPRGAAMAGFSTVGLLGVLLVLAGGATAMAADDDDTFEQKAIKGILSGLGVEVGRPDIDYRERSPLVVPPTRDLPPPQGSSAIDNPAWPKDPDLQRSKPSRGVFENGSWRQMQRDNAALSPDELRKGAIPGAGRVTKPGTEDSGRALRPDELGYAGTIFKDFFGYKAESEPFNGEPPRTTLTQPPAGYQTPSPSYPYGLSDSKSGVLTPVVPKKDRVERQ